MTNTEQQKAAADFAADWEKRGDEKSETHNYWIQLLRTVFGVENPENFIEFEKRVKLEHTSFIDAYIPATKVLIEQKSIDIDLSKSYQQSDGSMLTPYKQAKRYASEMPYDIRPRWIVVCNFREIHVHDMNNPNGEAEIIELKSLEKEYYRLSFLTDMGNIHLKREMEISIKAGELVGKIYDALIKRYKDPSNVHSLKSLNMLCVRLVFCLYAEDAGIFGHKSMFHDYLNRYESRELREKLILLFKVLDTKEEDRDPYLEEYLASFPYVNGGLFADTEIEIPNFTDDIKALLLQKASDNFDWSEISPTIFGAVFESTLNPETRRTGGMHYTSIENIHKVIDPLFMDSLNAEFNKITRMRAEKAKRTALLEFQKKLGRLKFLDPACGSGNFLTETFLSLRKLENKILTVLNNGNMLLGLNEFIKVGIHQFYGIEINDFAVTVAKTALWIAESQMVKETEKIMNISIDFLPLKNYANIVEGNALRLDWRYLYNPSSPDRTAIYAEEVNLMEVGEPTVHYGSIDLYTKKLLRNEPEVPKLQEVYYDYIMGNPPFVGARWMSDAQKKDLVSVFGRDWSGVGDLDFVTAWYKKTFDLIKSTNTKCAFVSTNSICQGAQVSNLWKPLFKQGLQMDFAYRTFRWDSESTLKAHVHCVIAGFSDKSSEQKDKFIFDESGRKQEGKNINGYLVDAADVFIEKRSKPLNAPHELNFGSMPNDGGFLLLSEKETNELLNNEPIAKKWIKQIKGSIELIQNKKLFCLWLKGISPKELRKMPIVYSRVEKVKKSRLSSNRDATKKLAETPYLFAEIRQPNTKYIAIPKVSSEKRRYIPTAFESPDIIAKDQLFVLPDSNLYEFGIINSNVHNAWMRAVCGRMKSDYNYSNTIVYNNFPWPTPNDKQKNRIEQTAQAILDARAKYPDSSLADLYDETSMPPELRKAHQENDKAVMNAYGFPIKMTESECVAELFKMYQKLVNK